MERYLTWLSIGTYLISLTQPCYCTPVSCGDSIAVVFSGILGVFMGGAALTWMANPLLITAWVTSNRNIRLSWIMSLLATVIAFSFLLFDNVISDEAGGYQPIISYSLGYWLWVSSASIMLVRNTIYRYKSANIK